MAGPLFRHVACCVDDSEPARRALELGARLRERDGGRLSVVHVALTAGAFVGARTVWMPEPESLDAQLREGAHEWLMELVADMPAAEPVLLEGTHPASAVCEWAADHACDLIVAAPHRGAVARLALGSFASYLAHHAPCSLLLARPGEGGASAPF